MTVGGFTKVSRLINILLNINFIGGMKEATKQNFFTAIRNNYFGWGHDLTSEEIKIIKERTEAFYWKGKPIETAPLSVQIDVSLIFL